MGLSGEYFFVVAGLVWPLIILSSAVIGGFWAYRFRHLSLETILTTLLNKIRHSWKKFIITIIISISLLVLVRTYLHQKTSIIIREAEEQHQRQLQ